MYTGCVIIAIPIRASLPYLSVASSPAASVWPPWRSGGQEWWSPQAVSFLSSALLVAQSTQPSFSQTAPNVSIMVLYKVHLDVYTSSFNSCVFCCVNLMKFCFAILASSWLSCPSFEYDKMKNSRYKTNTSMYLKTYKMFPFNFCSFLCNFFLYNDNEEHVHEMK